MRGIIACALFFISGTAQAEWRDWWLTREQQAQRALDAGNAEQAAQLFSDPRRRAYAELEAGRYDAAAKRLASLPDPPSQYNRGNALARAGDLRGALAAYDAALERAAAGSATERDARHNRDLVRRQLQKQEQQQQQQQQQQQGEQTPEEQAQNGESQQGGAGQSSAQQPSGQEGEDASPNQSGSADQDPSARDQSAQQPGGQPDEEAATDSREQRAAGPATARDEDRPGENGAVSPDESTPPPLPASERALAVEQWLRQIPDDPGGLLRRKFALEHRRKEREAQP